MSRIALPDDNWAELRDPKKVPERLRRPAKAASYALYQARKNDLEETASTETPQAPEGSGAFGAPPAPPAEAQVEYDMEQLQDSVDTGIVALIESWSFGEVITADTLMDLPGDCYDSLMEQCIPLIGEMFLTLTPPADLANADPADPS